MVQCSAAVSILIVFGVGLIISVIGLLHYMSVANEVKKDNEVLRSSVKRYRGIIFGNLKQKIKANPPVK